MSESPMFYDSDIVYNGLRHSVEALDTLTDLLAEARDLKNKKEKKKYDEQMEYIDTYCDACKSMVSIYVDLFALKINVMREEID